MQNKPRTRNAARSIADPVESFSLFIPDSLIDSTVKFTNNRILTFLKQFSELAQVATNHLINLDELKSLFWNSILARCIETEPVIFVFYLVS